MTNDEGHFVIEDDPTPVSPVRWWSPRQVVGWARIFGDHFGLREWHVYGGVAISGLGLSWWHHPAGVVWVGIMLIYLGLRKGPPSDGPIEPT